MKCPKCNKDITTVFVQESETLITKVEFQLIDGLLDEVSREEIDKSNLEYQSIVCPLCFEEISDKECIDDNTIISCLNGEIIK